jgi:DNA-directed RNA polymerase specialized sigma subunit
MLCTCRGWRYICPLCQAKADRWQAAIEEHEREHSPEVAEALQALNDREKEVTRLRDEEKDNTIII